MLQSLDEWLDYIVSLHTSRIDLGLERIKAIAEQNHLSTFHCPVITVAGTNGKGSCVRLLEGIYSTSGYRVGAYYSPHIQRFNERIRLQEQDIDDATLIAAFERIETCRRDRPLSFFEFTTLAALSIFQAAELDVVILEVGLGGRLDAVNIVESDVAVVTSIGLDHMDWLGDNLEQIAVEEAGVYRKDKPDICGQPKPPTSLVDVAVSVGAQLLCLDRDFCYQIHEQNWHWQGPENHYQSLPMPLLKCQNAATSLMVIECLQQQLPVVVVDIANALKNKTLPGRFQQASVPMNVVFDVAHNPDSARYLADQLKRLPAATKQIALIGMLETKDIRGTLMPLIQYIDDWFVVKLATERSAEPSQIMDTLKALGAKNCYNLPSVSEAVCRAKQACGHQQDRIVVFGSCYTVAEVQQLLREELEV